MPSIGEVGIWISSLRSAAQPLLFDVAQIHSAAVLKMTAAHGRGGTDGGRPESVARFRTLRLAGERIWRIRYVQSGGTL